MVKLICCRGLSASGKSTFARGVVEKDPQYVRVNRDDIRAMIHNDVWNQKREKTTAWIRNAIIRATLAAGKSVICDDTNLSPKVCAELEGLAKEVGAAFEIKDFTDVSPQECIKRDLKREKSVGASVIWKQYRDYLKPEPVKQDPDLPKAIIVDMDGTLAKIWEGRSPYQDDLAGNDYRNDPVADMVEGYMNSNPDTHFIIMSGRDEGRSRAVTLEWINTHLSVQPHALFMRSAGDIRHDNIVKRELFDEHVRDKFYVNFIVDDRDSVIALWRDELGLTALQVNYGDF